MIRCCLTLVCTLLLTGLGPAFAADPVPDLSLAGAKVSEKVPAESPKAPEPPKAPTEPPKAPEPPTVLAEPEPIPQPVLEVWDTLLQTRLKELDAILVQGKALQESLAASSKTFSANQDKVDQDYQRVSAVAQVSRGLPVELTVVDENLRRLQERLTVVLQPLEGALQTLQQRFSEMSLLEKGTGTVEDGKGGKTVANAADTPALRDFLKKLEQTRKLLDQLQTRIQRILLPARSLAESMQAQKVAIEERLPVLWRDYYLKPSGRLYEAETWHGLEQSVQVMRETFSLRLNAELPTTPKEWFNVLARMGIVLLPLHLLLALSRRVARRGPQTLAKGWERLTRHSLPWLTVGLAIHFAAWSSGGEAYRVLSVVGTFLMSLGQVALAWDLYTFEQPGASRRSQLWQLITPLVWGLLLLLLNLPAPLLCACWLVLTGIFLWLENNRKADPEEERTALVNNLLFCHLAVLWITGIMAVLGWGRMSILVCMGYAGLAVIIMQAVGFMRLSSVISSLLPEKGMRALVGGVVLALAVPTVLVLVTLATGLWILAYPGGAALLKQMALLDFNVGRTSFNMLQVLLIISAFYVTRSIIVVGCTFLRELPSNGVRVDQSLLGPIQVAYTYILWALFGLYSLSALGFSLTSLAVVAGGLSVGIGFGLQNIINNFVSGLLVIFGQTLREGDVIEVGNLTGTVKRINVRSTVVETADNAVIFVPNAEFLSGRLTNWTRNGRMVRREVSVGVAYGSDVPKVIQTLQEIAATNRSVLKYPEPMVLFNNFGASSLEFILRFWVADIVHALPILTEVRIEIDRRFREESIEIAFPQMDVHLKREPMPVAMAMATANDMGDAINTDSSKIGLSQTDSSQTATSKESNNDRVSA